MEFVLNELSFFSSMSEEEKEDCFGQFFEHVLALEKLSLPDYSERTRILIAKKEFYEFRIALRIWIDKSKKRDVEIKKMFNLLDMMKKKIVSPEYLYNEDEAKGLGYAYENELLCLSLSTSEEWDKDYIQLVKFEYIGDGMMEKKEVITVKHTIKKEHTISHKIWNRIEFINKAPKVIPNRLAQTKKSLFPQLNASNELVNDIEVENIGNVKSWGDFYEKLIRQETGIKIGVLKSIFENFMEINGWVKNERVTNSNQRTVYEAGKLYAALDTQHGTIEVHDSKGTHKGEYRFDGTFEKNSKHTLKI